MHERMAFPTRALPESRKMCKLLGLTAALVILTSEAPAYAGKGPDNPVDKVTVVQQEWRREGKTMLANVTFYNRNGFSVKNVIVKCEVYEQTQMPQTRRGITVKRVLPPGRTTVSDLAFSIVTNDAQGGSCQVLSAQKV